MIKQTTIKVNKKLDQIIFNEDYICINGAYIIASYLVKIDNEEMQNKVNKGESFAYGAGRYLADVPSLKQFINALHTDMDLLEDTELISDTWAGKHKVFYNPVKNYFSYFDIDYLKQFTKTRLTLRLHQAKKLEGAGHYDNDLKCLFYIMPVNLKSCFVERFV